LVGGLDPAANLEHACADLVEEQLAGQPIAAWSDADLEAFCKRYNLGWVVCRSAAAVERLESWCRSGAAERTAALSIDHETGYLYTLRRERSFVLKGKARWLQADCRHIVLGDLVPDDGTVVLSLHYQAGMQVSPGQVQVEKDPDSLDPIPLIRLKLPGPVTRLILTWPKS
jgi:hypothetical protein